MCSAFSKSEGSNIDTSKKTKGIKKKDPKKMEGQYQKAAENCWTSLGLNSQ